MRKPPNVPCPPRNPHCHDEVIGVSVHSDILTIILIVVMLVGMFFIFKEIEKWKNQ